MAIKFIDYFCSNKNFYVLVVGATLSFYKRIQIISLKLVEITKKEI